MFQNQSFKKKGAVAQLGERLDGIQKVVGSIPSSSTITKIYLIVLLLFLFSNQNTSANTVNSYKLLIPGETFRNENQKESEIENYIGSGVSYKSWRQRKCYKKAFVIFQNSKLCTHDPHLCAQDYAVDEIHFFQRYKKLLNKISDVCAEGYPLDYQDRKVIKGHSTKEVEEFIVYLKNKKKVDYDNPPINKSVNIINKPKEKEKKRPVQTGAHGALNNVIDENKTQNLNSSENEIKDKEAQLLKMEQKLTIEKELLEEEKKLLEKKKKLQELEIKIFESEEILKKKRKNIN